MSEVQIALLYRINNFQWVYKTTHSRRELEGHGYFKHRLSPGEGVFVTHFRNERVAGQSTYLIDNEGRARLTWSSMLKEETRGFEDD